VGADELDEAVAHRALGVALSISLDVSEITNMAVLVAGSAVGLPVGVDYSGSAAPAGRGVKGYPGGSIQ